MSISEIQKYIDQNLTQRQIAEKLGVSHTTLRYWLKKYNMKTRTTRYRTWTDQQLIDAVEKSEYMSDVILSLGLTVRPGNYETVKLHVKRLGLDTTHFLGNSSKNRRGGPSPIPDDVLFSQDSVHGRGVAKSRIIKNNLFPYECALCGIAEWHKKKLSLVLDHINGVNNDHRLDNLRFLCPNCNSQQDTFCRKN